MEEIRVPRSLGGHGLDDVLADAVVVQQRRRELEWERKLSALESEQKSMVLNAMRRLLRLKGSLGELAVEGVGGVGAA